MDAFISSLEIPKGTTEQNLWQGLLRRPKPFKKTRTLSETVTYIKPPYSGSPAQEEPFVKIDSNYSEAIEEANNQKARIKKNYTNIMDKARILGMGPPPVQQVTLNVSKDTSRKVATPELDEEVNKIEGMNKERKSESVSEYYESTDHKYFPKSKPKAAILIFGIN